MKVLVCGSRDWPSPLADSAIKDRLLRLPRGAEVIHGGAPGADYWGGYWAKSIGLPVRAFKADWKRYGKKAGPLRNLQMLDEKPDLVLAFQHNGSRGTQHTIDEARKRGIPVEVYSA